MAKQHKKVTEGVISSLNVSSEDTNAINDGNQTRALRKRPKIEAALEPSSVMETKAVSNEIVARSKRSRKTTKCAENITASDHAPSKVRNIQRRNSKLDTKEETAKKKGRKAEKEESTEEEEMEIKQEAMKMGEEVVTSVPSKIRKTSQKHLKSDGEEISLKRKSRQVKKKEKIEKVKLELNEEEKDVKVKDAKKKRLTKAQVREQMVNSLEKIMHKEDYKFPMEHVNRSRMINGFNGSVSCTGKAFVGAHVSAQGGLAEAVYNAAEIGARSFALFLRSQRQWTAKPLEQKTIDDFRKAREDFGYPSHLILPHGSYLLNLGSSKDENLQKSRQLLLEEIQRCEALGLTHYNFHPGSTCGECTVEECLTHIAESLNWVHEKTYPSKVMTVIENMSKQGNTVGGFLHEIGQIISQVKDKERVGVCIDTCHAFAAGYDLASEKGFQKLVEDIDKEIGFEYIVAMHLNDSKFPVNSHKDRHENIGKGKIGKEGFRRIMNSKYFRDIPLILETPWDESKSSPYAREIKLLYSLQEV